MKQLTYLLAAVIMVACSTMPAQAKALDLNNVCGKAKTISLEAGHDADFPNIVEPAGSATAPSWDLKLLGGQDITIHCYADGTPGSDKPVALPAGLQQCSAVGTVLSCH